MPKIVKSIKGELVDFDLLKIKKEMESTPQPILVSERKQFIDNKLQRRIRRAKTGILDAKNKSQNKESRNGLVELEPKTELKTEPKLKTESKPPIKKVKKVKNESTKK